MIRPGRWSRRRGLAALALVVAGSTAGAGAAAGASGWPLYAGGALLLLAAVALLVPAAITAQVVAGQALVASLLLAPDGPPALLLLPLVAGVVATAELLGETARRGGPFGDRPGHPFRDAARAAVIAGGAFGAVVLLSVPGPGGLRGLLLASGGCVLLAVLLARGGLGGRTGP